MVEGFYVRQDPKSSYGASLKLFQSDVEDWWAVVAITKSNLVQGKFVSIRGAPTSSADGGTLMDFLQHLIDACAA